MPGELTSVLTLERLLELFTEVRATGRPLQLAIETKHPTRWAGQVEERLLRTLRRFGLDAPPADEPSPVRVMSFSARSLHRVQAAAPALPTVYLMQFVSPRMRDGRLPAPGSRGRACGSCAATPGTSNDCTARATGSTCGP